MIKSITRTLYIDGRLIESHMQEPDEWSKLALIPLNNQLLKTEVWLGRDPRNKQQKDMALSNFNLIKYYHDTAIVVSLKLEGDEMKLKTWYVLRDSDKRRGLLIKRKQ